MSAFERRSTIINRKFFEYLVPTILSAIAISLNEFVDSIIVSRLLGNEAMGLLHIAFPIMLLFAMVHTFLGVGGSIIYAECAGRQEPEKARKVFSVTIIFSVLFSLAFIVIGFVFMDGIIHILKVPSESYDVFYLYIRRLLLSVLFILPLQTVISFSPALGAPRLGSAVNITANLINLIMDYVYIRFFGMNIEGAASATMTGYIVGLIIVIIAICAHKMPFPFTLPSFSDFRMIPTVIVRGLPSSLTQLGYSIKIVFCNLLAHNIGGFVAVRIFALCIQVVSIVSIAISGIVCAMVPIAASLYGQRDFAGIKILMSTVLKVQFAANLVFVVLFEMFPQRIMMLYNGFSLPLSATVVAIRLFSIMFIFRGFSVMYMYYFQVIQKKTYANVISLVDGFVGIIPVSLILTHFIGINGLWAAYPVLAVLLDAGIVVTNMIIARKSRGRYRNFMLFEQEREDVAVYDVSFIASDEQIVKNTKDLELFCSEHEVGQTASMFAGVIAEEISVITRNNKNKKGTDQIDMLVKVYPDHLLFDFRSIGKPFDVSSNVSRGSNLDVLRKVSYSADFSYVMGMNLTRIKLMR